MMVFFGKWDSVYWTIAQFVAFLVVFSTTLIFRKVRNKESWGAIILTMVVFTVYLGMVGSREITKYKNRLCTDKFGPEFNARRRSLGIPQIPADWHEARTFNHSATWEQKDSTTGHHNKRISIDSTCAIEFEDDRYYLKPINGKTCGMWVQSWYAKGKSENSVSFNYEYGYSSSTITRQQADSIFAAEKIQKDY